MKDEFFVDTNVLVYAFDESEPNKRRKAKTLVEDITKGKLKGTISNQILGELFTALTKKIENPLQKAQAQIIVNGLIDSQHWKKTNYTTQTISRAVETSINEKKPFWDSVILETMLENKVYTIYTENTKDFTNTKINTINPFTR
ncbi:MAG: PIN domain-containing protein [archaeon]|nr:PIN domain-containing protein [archaeon]